MTGQIPLEETFLLSIWAEVRAITALAILALTHRFHFRGSCMVTITVNEILYMA